MGNQCECVAKDKKGAGESSNPGVINIPQQKKKGQSVARESRDLLLGKV